MNNLRKSFKLITYTVGFKRQIVMISIFLIIGIIIEIATGCANVVGGFYIALVGSVPGQMLLLVTVPGLVNSSPYYYDIVVKKTALLNFLCEITCFTIVVIIHSIYAAVRPEKASVSFTIVFLVSLILLITQIIYPLMYKHYIVSFVILMIGVFSIFIPFSRYIYGESSFNMPGGLMVVLGYTFVALGLVGGTLVNNIFYKKEIDPLTYKSMIKKIDGSF